MKIGLVGCDNQKGLGSLNRDLARWLPADRWLIPISESLESSCSQSRDFSCRREFVDCGRDQRQRLATWLRGLDWVLFAETPWFGELPKLAREQGVRVACVPLWEQMHPGLAWLDDVDFMLCPNRYAKQVMEDWKGRFGFGWRTQEVPWPIDARRFRFQPRSVCRRFVFINGMGGKRPDPFAEGGAASYRRKGLELLVETARLLPNIPFLVWSQTDDVPCSPANVEFRSPLRDQAKLYAEGDVCVQPSHWEGIGLPLLECQASGMPLVTTDAPPMNEYQPWATIPASRSEPVRLSPWRVIRAYQMEPARAAEVLGSLHGRDIAAASRNARAFVEREHSWLLTRSRILKGLRAWP